MNCRCASKFLPPLAALLLLLAACARQTGLPAPDSKEYRELVAAFYVGLAGLQTGEDVRAKEKLTLATRIAPGEPAGWANLGLFAVRQQEFDAAYENVEQARQLAPDNSRIEALLGLIESRRGKLPEAIGHLKKAVELDAKNLKALYALAQETERQGEESSDAEAQKFLEKILETQPDNLAALLDVARLAAKRGDGEALKRAVANLSEQSAAWPDEAKRQIVALQQVATGDNPRGAATQSAFLRNVLARVPDYRRSLNAVKTPAEFVGDPFLKFLKLPSPSSQPAPPDTTLSFVAEPLPSGNERQAIPLMAVPLDSESKPSLISFDQQGIRIAGGATFPANTTAPFGVAALDFDYDFKTDIVIAGEDGARFHRQQTINAFADVTAATKLPPNILRAAYRDLAPFDFELDGDLDLLLFSRPPATQPSLLRNNGDGTFKEMFPFANLEAVRQLVAADLDEDGDPDLAFIAGDRLRVFANERLGQYRERAVPSSLGVVAAIAVADLNSDGALDLVTLERDGRIARLSDKGGGTDWEIVEAARVEAGARANDQARAIRLALADLDNNGALDIIADGARALLGDAQGKFVSINLPADTQVAAISDVNNDGRLDLIGVQRDGRIVQLINRGTKNYHSQTLRTRAAQSTGDQRINSFGIGGEIEIRSGLLTQKQAITSSLLHFGLGENTRADVARIVWPNGSVQAEFELQADQSILAEQRLKGSCPMLFAWDGKQISYVKDAAPWSPALGLRINAQDVAGIYQTEEWFKIRGDQLLPRDGFYDLRVTAELWETFYIDHYSLLVVDRPLGTEVFADERFAVPPPPLKLYATNTPRPFARAKDDLGRDVSAVVRDLDEKYLDTFGKGRYQGVTRDHWVELELPQREGPRPARLYLIGHGFIHPTDGTINVAYGQTSYAPPRGLSIEVPDPSGAWATARSGLGFPAGKLKTIALDLTNVFRPGAARKLRLRTSMEIYWDKLEWAEGLPEATFKAQRINLSSAELRWRGFSTFTRANDSSPELPDYNQLAGASQKWRDLIGYYTRHGDVRELLEKIDDRMVIVNAGDEIRLKFPAPPPPPAGWARDYVMVGDGWIKDGDLNSTFSKTVLPLPYHGMKDYTAPPGQLEDDPAYQRHPEDWRKYHTRYVTPDYFLKALRER